MDTRSTEPSLEVAKCAEQAQVNQFKVNGGGGLGPIGCMPNLKTYITGPFTAPARFTWKRRRSAHRAVPKGICALLQACGADVQHCVAGRRRLAVHRRSHEAPGRPEKKGA